MMANLFLQKFPSKMKSFSTIIILLLGLYYLDATSIQTPPRIVKQPPAGEIFRIEALESETYFRLECEATGDPLPKYRWTKNGKPFDWQSSDGDISQPPGIGTLYFLNFRKSDVGLYQCYAENELGVATSNAVFLRSSELKSFQNTKPIDLIGNEGEPFKLNCAAPEAYPKPKIYWVIQYTTGNIKSINDSRITVDSEGSLWFSTLTKEDSTEDFTYACAASSATRLEYKLGNRVSLHVVSAGKTIPNHPLVLQYVSRRNEIALRGKTVELYCIFGGRPVPEIEWKKNGNIIKQSDRITEANYGKTLIIKLVDFEDEGSYTCTANNGIGKSQDYSIHLEVLAAPYFTVAPKSVIANVSETAEIECVASGVPQPQIQWLYNGQPIIEAPANSRRIVEDNKIVINNLTKADIGNYACNASTILGYIFKDVSVNVLEL